MQVPQQGLIAQMQWQFLSVAAFSLLFSPALAAEPAAPSLARFDAYPHAVRVNHRVSEVVDREIGLGALRKVRGAWGFKHSERLSGTLTAYTWQIVDGFSANEVLEEIEAALETERLLFACDGRSCGQGVAWANRVFRERLLYGRDDLQRYRVYGPAEGDSYRLLLFSASRTADRQYLHAEVLERGD